MSAPLPKIMSWPMGGVDADGRLGWSTDDRSVREVILNILLTRPGERLQRADFGAGLLGFVHQPNNETTRSMMASSVRKSIELWEPRITVEEVDVVPDAANVADVHINIRYRMRFSQAPAELGFTFNLGQSA
jgi:phage baseplate assembly protein W